MIAFDVESGQPPSGELVYNANEHAFDTALRSEEGEASLLLNDLQLEVDGENRVLFVWGLCPRSIWIATKATTPKARPGRLRVRGVELIAGTSKRLNPSERWPVMVNERSGWVCVGDPSAAGDAVLFAAGSVAVLDSGALKALWLKPAGLRAVTNGGGG